MGLMKTMQNIKINKTQDRHSSWYNMANDTSVKYSHQLVLWLVNFVAYCFCVFLKIDSSNKTHIHRNTNINGLKHRQYASGKLRNKFTVFPNPGLRRKLIELMNWLHEIAGIVWRSVNTLHGRSQQTLTTRTNALHRQAHDRKPKTTRHQIDPQTESRHWQNVT